MGRTVPLPGILRAGDGGLLRLFAPAIEPADHMHRPRCCQTPGSGSEQGHQQGEQQQRRPLEDHPPAHQLVGALPGCRRLGPGRTARRTARRACRASAGRPGSRGRSSRGYIDERGLYTCPQSRIGTRRVHCHVVDRSRPIVSGAMPMLRLLIFAGLAAALAPVAVRAPHARSDSPDAGATGAGGAAGPAEARRRSSTTLETIARNQRRRPPTGNPRADTGSRSRTATRSPAAPTIAPNSLGAQMLVGASDLPEPRVQPGDRRTVGASAVCRRCGAG